MSLSASLARNSALQIGGKVLGTLFGLVTFYFLLHFFGTDGYGVLTVAMTYVSVFAVIVDFGLTLTTTQMISERGASEEKILGNLLSLRVITALAFLSLAPLSALFVPQMRDLAVLISVFAASSFFAAASQTFVGVFQKRISLIIPVFAETANRLVALAVILLIGFTHPVFSGVALAFLLGGAVQFTLMLFGVGSLVRLRPAFQLSVWREIIGRSWPIGLSIFFNLIYLKGDVLFMSLLGVTDEVIGQYGAAYKVVDVITVIPVTFMGLMLPLLARAWSERKKDLFEKHLQNTFDVFAFIALPFAFGAFLLGVPLMTVLKPDLVLAGQVLAVLGPAASIVFFNSLYGHAVVAVQKQRAMTFAYIFVAILAVWGYLYSIPLYGAWGAAWVTLGSEALIGLLAFLVVTLSAKTLPKPLMFVRALFASVVMTVAIILFPFANVFLDIALGIVVYGVTLMLIGGPNVKTLSRLFLPEKPSVNM